MRWLGLLFSIALSLSLTLQFCIGSTEQTRLVLTGSSTVAPLLEAIAQRYQISHPNIDIEIQSKDSDKGIEDTRLAENDIGMASRTQRDNERVLHFFTVAYDGIGLLVHQSNEIESLSRQQVIDIYTGKITNWRQVGSHDAPITALSISEANSTSELFANFFGLAISSLQSDRRVSHNEALLKAVSANENAVGYVSIGAAEYQIIHGISLKMLPLGGIPATTQSVSNRIFPLARPLSLITKEEPVGLARDFIEFSLSPSVEDIIRKQAFVAPQHSKTTTDLNSY